MDSNAALATLQQQQASYKDPNAILAEQRNQLGTQNAQNTVTGLRGAIDNTTKLLKQVAPGVMGRTANSLVTSGQANRIIQNESAPIQQSLSDQGEKYNRASEDYNKLESEAERQAAGVADAQANKLSYAQNLYNLLYQREQDAATKAFEERKYQDALKAAASSGGSSGGSGSGRSGGGGVPTAQVAKVEAFLKPQLGKKDNYASPYDYNEAKSAWIQDGYSASQFDGIFGKYKNPKTKGYR